jgi:cysteine-rich repeat protein
MIRSSIVLRILTMATVVARVAAAQPVQVEPPFDVVTSPAGAFVSAFAIDGSGSALALWEGGESVVLGRLFDQSGVAASPVFRLETPVDAASRTAALAGLPQGGFVAVWEARRSGSTRLYVQCVSAAGHVLGVAQRLDQRGDGANQRPGNATVAVSPSGRILTLWEEDEVNSSPLEGRFLDDECVPLGNVFTIATGPTRFPRSPQAVFDGEDRFLIAAWSTLTDDPGLVAQVHAGDGTPISPTFTLWERPVGGAPAVAVDPQGGFLVAWIARTPASSQHLVMARRLAPPGFGPGATVALAPFTPGRALHYSPSMAFQADGTLFVAWPQGHSLLARAFAPDGLPHGGVFEVGQAEDAGGALVLRAPAGRFVVSWSATPSDTRVASRRRVHRFSLCGNTLLDPGELCDDGNARDDDCCSATCAPRPFDGACWLLSGRSVLRATARGIYRGQRVVCTHRCQVADRSLLVLGDDGTYHIPGGLAVCADQQVIAVPDERGDVVGKPRRFKTVPGNVDEVASALLTCSGTQLRRLTGRFHMARDGSELVGTHRSVARQAGELPIRLRVRTTVAGARSDEGSFPDLARRGRHLRECSAPLRLTCYRD